MKKFLIKASYAAEGVKGLLKVGSTNRKQTVEKMINSLGGKLESFYSAFGDHDIYAIGEGLDNASMAAFVLTIDASGLVSVSTTVLLSPEDIDKAAKVSVDYRSPGK